MSGSVSVNGRSMNIPKLPDIPAVKADGTMDPAAQMRYQQQLQARTEMISFITNIMKTQHQASMAVIGNMR